jgi:uncharacterized protein (DUF433 family)
VQLSSLAIVEAGERIGQVGVAMALPQREPSLIDRWIEQSPHYPGPQEARLVEYGVSVWVLIAYLRAVGGDAARVAEDYDLPLEAVEAAIAYYREHQALIDAQIIANAVASAG